MSNKRNIIIAAVAALALAGVAFAAYPATAEEEEGAPEVILVITSTFPRLEGVVSVINASGEPAQAASVALVSTIDGAEALPPAKSNGFTGSNGQFAFSFPLASTASVPGDHTLTVTVTTQGGATTTVSVPYTVSA